MGNKKTLGSVEIDETEPQCGPNNPLDWSTNGIGLNKSVTKGRFLLDKDGKLLILPVLPIEYNTIAGAKIGKGIYPFNLLNIKSGLFEQQRTPDTFKSGIATAVGNTALWTPATGKKFRLMGFVITFSSDFVCTGAGSLSYVRFLDQAANIIQFCVGATTSPQVLAPIVCTLPGNGYLSTAVNNVLNFALGASVLTSGTVSVYVWGNEE